MGNRISTIQELVISTIIIYHGFVNGRTISEECEVSSEGVYMDENGQRVVDLIPITEGAREQKHVVNLLLCGIDSDKDTGLNLSKNTLCWLEQG